MDFFTKQKETYRLREGDMVTGERGEGRDN